MRVSGLFQRIPLFRPSHPMKTNRIQCLHLEKLQMKKIFLVAFYLVIVLTVNAQSAKISEVKQGTTVQVEFYAQGQIYPMVLKVATLSADELVFSYDFMGSVMGKFFNNKANLDKGQRFNWEEPVNGEERKVSDDQTLMVISRTAFKELKENKKSSYNKQVLLRKEIPEGQELSSGGTQIDVIYAESENGSTKYWILNNDAYPLLLKLSGNPGGIDVVMTGFK